MLRARQLQLLLAQIDRLPEADREAVRAHVRPADVAQIQAAGGLDWIPMKLSTDLTHAVTTGLGRDRARTFFRAQFAVTLENAVLGSLVAAVTRHVTSDPRPGLRWLSRGHDLLFRGVGRVVVTTSPDRPEAFVSLVDLPRELAADRVWLDRYAWSVASLDAVWHTTLDCEVVESSEEERFARMRIWWSERTPPRHR